ncbi:PAS domain-containing protein [Calothrix sp. UHCC 0171]|uniref:PAS domain-containing protein n=1 Tax=Calothrix sp. UHCC 0171 TaxID=3110245 RepID=UPI002B1FF307|nr:PAS domain-containing protein [Calothrix sp. UHCC 0171]MEA5570804.1 PAS domain-containing protein [Calothrix sp. UHCC 0171]
MHIEEPATQQFEVDASQRCAPVSTEPGLLSALQMLEDKQQLQSALRIALEKNGLGLWEWNPVTGNFHYDSLSLSILGDENAEISNYKAFERLIHPQDLPHLLNVRKRFLENIEATYEVEFRIATKSGDWKWIMERGVGELIVDLVNVKTKEGKIPQKQKILVRISDNGKGILPHIQRRIFEPFFTTKAATKTNGLGLEIKHPGKLSCKSQLGKCSDFLIEIGTEAKIYSHLRKRASC